MRWYGSVSVLSLQTQAEPYTLPAFREVAMRSEAYVDTERPDRAFVTTKYYVDSDGNVVKEKQMEALLRF